jgi:hypothetical protein
MRRIRRGAIIAFLAVFQLSALPLARAQAPAPPPPAAPPPAVLAPPASPPPAAEPYEALPSPLTAPQLRGPAVRLRADRPEARLQKMQLRWRDVCAAPCGVAVDPRPLYRIAGRGIKPSDGFNLPRPSGDVSIDAFTGSQTRYWVGAGMTIAGAAGLVGGGLSLLARSAINNSSSDSSSQSLSNFYKVVGISDLIIGSVLVLLGAPLWLGSRTTIQVR